MLHLCNTRDSNDQIVRIYSKTRELEHQTVTRLHNVLHKNGLDKAESRLKAVDQDNCPRDQHDRYDY